MSDLGIRISALLSKNAKENLQKQLDEVSKSLKLTVTNAQVVSNNVESMAQATGDVSGNVKKTIHVLSEYEQKINDLIHRYKMFQVAEDQFIKEMNELILTTDKTAYSQEFLNLKWQKQENIIRLLTQAENKYRRVVEERIKVEQKNQQQKEKQIKQYQKFVDQIDKQRIAQQKLLDQIRGLRGKEGRILSSELLSQLDGLENRIRNLDPLSENFNKHLGQAQLEFGKLNTTVGIYKKQIQEASQFTGIFGQSLLEAGRKFATWVFIGNTIMGTVRAVRSGIQTLKDLDSVMVEVEKVTDFTVEQLNEIKDASFDIASGFGRDARDYLASVAEFSRAGYEKTAKNLAQVSLLAQNVGELTADQANAFLLATDAAYLFGGNLEVLTRVLDGVNEIDNKFATSIQKVSEGMTVAGSIAKNAKVEVDELAAAIGTMTAVTQRSGNEAGRALRAILMNLRQIRGEVSEGEYIDDEALSKSSAALAQVGIKVYELKNGIEELRNPMEVLKELGTIWKDLSTMQQATIIEALGGKHRGNMLVALLENFEMYERMLDAFANSAGSAMAENEKRLGSWQSKVNQFTNAVSEMWNNAIDTDAIKLFIDSGTLFITVLDKVIQSVGILTPIVIALSATIMAVQRRTIEYSTQLRNLQQEFIKGELSVKKFRAELINLWHTQGRVAYGFSSLTAATNVFRASLITLGVTIATVLPQMLLIGGLTFAFQKLYSIVKDLREEARQSAEQNKIIAENFIKQQDEINELINRYKELSNIEEKTVEQAQEYVEIQNRLGELLPLLVSYTDEYGNSVLKKGNALQLAIDRTKELAEEEKEYIQSNFRKEIADREKQIAKLYKKLEDFEKQRERSLKYGGNTENFDRVIAKLRYEIKELQFEIEDFVDSLPKGFRELEEGSKDTINILEDLTETINKYNKSLKSLLDENQEVVDKLSSYRSIINDLNEGKKVSADTIHNLIKKYDDFAQAVEVENGVLRVNKEVLENLTNTIQNKTIASREAQIAETKNAIQQSLQRLKIYNIELNAIRSVTDAYIASTNAIYESLGQHHDSGITNKVRMNLFKTLEPLGKAIEDLERFKAILSGVGTSSTSSMNKTSSSAVEKTFISLPYYSEQLTDILNQLNEIEMEIGELDNQLKLAKAEENTERIISLQNKLIEKRKEERGILQQTVNEIKNLQSTIRQEILSTFGFDIITATKEDIAKMLDSLQKSIVEQQNIASKATSTAIKEAAKKEEERLNHHKQLLQELVKNYEGTSKELADLGKQMWTSFFGEIDLIKANQEILNRLANDTINVYKDMYRRQKEIALKAIDVELKALEKAHKAKVEMLDDELKRYEDIINAKLKALEREEEAEDYAEKLAKAQRERQELLNKINVLALDDSLEARKQLVDLNEKLAEKEHEIEKMQKDRSRTLRKNELKDQLDQYKKQYDEKKKNLEHQVKLENKYRQDSYENLKEWLEKEKEEVARYYDDLINDERRYNSIREEITRGYFNNVQGDFESFKWYLERHSEDIGRSLTRNILDVIKAIGDEMRSISLTPPNTNMPPPSSTPFPSPSTSPSSGSINLENEAKYLHNLMVTALQTGNKGLEAWVRKRRKELGIDPDTGAILTRHKGGFAGEVTNKMLLGVDELFNRKLGSNEVMVRALKDELFIPSANIFNNFIPNMQKILGGVQQPVMAGNTYHFYLNIDRLIGDRNSAKMLVKEMVNEVKRRGVKL